jgi:inner membrane protein
MKNHPLLSKLLTAMALLALLWLALAMVGGVVNERTSYRDTATDEVSRLNAGQQTVLGPFMYWPYSERYVVRSADKSESVQHTERGMLLRFAQTLSVDATLNTQVLQRGVFPVTVYQTEHHLSGRFEAQASTPPLPQQPGGTLTMERPWLVFRVSDLRGLSGTPVLKLGEHNLTVVSHTLPGLGAVLAAELPPDTWTQELPFDLRFGLGGTGSIAWVPLGDTSDMALRANWPHPRFGGDFLPRERDINAQGFEARWGTTSLASQAQQQLASQLQHNERDDLAAIERMKVDLIEPLDIYQQTERATKYGLLFVLLTFVAFFLLEMVKRWRIHPMQYLMVGSALTLFFLLLLSLSERLGFAWAYAVATSACLGLLAVYLSAVLGNWRRGIGMSALLVVLYGLLYGILMSEDNALLMGSLLLFGALAAAMLVTRKLDWHALNS